MKQIIPKYPAKPPPKPKLKNDVFSFQNLLKAYYQCRKRKRKTLNASKFELYFEKNLLELEKELKNKTYKPGKSICFVVTDPKPREVFAADFRDRIIHHLLIGYLEPVYEKIFIHHSYACRKNKGAHLVIKNLKKPIPRFYLQCDIAAFFTSLKKDILLNLVKRRIKNPDMLWLAEKIIFHDPTENYRLKSKPNLIKLIPPQKSLFCVPKNQGLPIGNLSSQFFANVYLNELDQHAKHRLKIKDYHRYVDDILLLDNSPQQLKNWHNEINDFLKENLKIRLHPQKTILKMTKDGINFVGYIIKPSHLLVRKRTAGNLKRKLWIFNQMINSKKIRPNTEELDKIISTINSYCGQFKHANTFNLRKSLYNNHFKKLTSWIEPANKSFDYFKIKKFS